VQAEQTPQRSPMAFIFLTVFIDLLGIGIVIPVLPFYVKILEASGEAWFTVNRALIVGALSAAYALMQFLCAPWLGSLSDRYGRRPVLLISLAGTGIGYLLFGASEYLLVLSPWLMLGALFVSRILDGVTGANISTAQAYIADITTPENRARGLGMIGAAFGLGFMLGPALGGVLSTYGLAVPVYVAAAMSFANVLFGYFVLPESLPPERRATQVQGINPLSRVQRVLAQSEIRPLLIGIVLLNLAFAGMQSNFAVYSDRRYGMTAYDNAWIFATVGLVAVIVQGFLLRMLVPRFGEERLAMVGMVVMAIGFEGLAVAPTALWLYPAIVLLAIGSGMATPSLTSLVSRRVSAQAQGVTLGGSQALVSLTTVVAPLLAGVLSDVVNYTAPYHVGGALVASAAAVIIMVLWQRQPARELSPAE
jgi:DHA1 family tetracycline resistance protein-like MFS transporter